uniref:Integrin alpha-2 domain-containing protein n=1 Tax=Panagrolaimus superbus TaxID=310955 RepID=A0A914YIK9_9BILA
MNWAPLWARPPGLLFLCFFITQITCFNVDVRKPLVHRSSGGGSFGYSIDFYHSGNNNNLLLVGAPFGQSNQRGIIKGGVVYACDVRSQRCSQLHFDQTGNEQRLNGSTRLNIEEKSHQMFGATVVASKKGNAAIACAPHYKYFFSKFEVIEPVGTCYYATDNFQKIDEFAPCRQEPARHGHHRFGYGMCGFSAAIPDDGNSRLFISAPGTWYWQGATFSQNIHNKTDRPNTKDGPAHTDHHQMGYSTAAGDFDGDGLDDIVAGVPRGNELVGMVSIYTRDLHSIVNLTDEKGQRGQYFGGSVAVTDLNKDGLDDLIVGSPFYTNYKTAFDAKTQEHKPQYDIGKVTVYIQSGPGTFREPIHLIGHSQWSRFGYSIAAAGDLNGDGYNDFIVGAPYDGEEKRGAVYIYHGSEDGVRQEHTQRIGADNLHPDLKTFGFSVAGSRDIDDNGYPDIAVGATESNQAVILRTKPVMQITGSVKTNKKTINLEDKLCASEFGRMPCEKVKFCVKYNGKLRPEHNNLDVKVQIKLDNKKLGEPRAFFSPKELARKRNVKISFQSISKNQPDVIEQTLTMTKNRELCETHDVYVPDTIRDKISPIIVSVNYTYVERRLSGDLLEPAVDTTLPQAFTTELVIEKDCGEDNVCIPDLQMTAKPTREKFTLGTTDNSLLTNVTIRNSGEASYLTQLFITIPPGFEYGGIEKYGTKQSISCSPSENNSNKKDEPYDFVCDIGNPLPANEKVDFGVRLTGTNVDTSKENVEIKMRVNSTNEEEAGHDNDNAFTVNIPLEIKAQLSLTARSNPDQVDYSVKNRTDLDKAVFDFEVGPLVSHLYQVINRGPSSVKKARFDLFFPSFSEEGKDLLYLLDLPRVNDPEKAVCKVLQGQNINPRSLTISNEHIPTASTAPFDDENDEDENDENRHHEDDDDEEFETEHERYGDEDDVNRKRREVQRQRRQMKKGEAKQLRQQKEAMKQAVKLVKDSGHQAIEYRGKLNPAAVNCDALNCTQITCDIYDLNEGEFVLIEVFSRVWVNTLIEDNIYEADISSLGFVQVTELPHSTTYRPLPQVAAVTTDVNPTDTEADQSIPWWLILLAILIALLILGLIILCCWKCGFFKRDRPHYEKAELNKGATNGDYYADNSARYAQPHTLSPDRHGTHV